MTYWATIWFAGTVIFTVEAGDSGLEKCIDYSDRMDQVIEKAFLDGDPRTFETMPFENRFEFSCETEQFSIGQRID